MGEEEAITKLMALDGLSSDDVEMYHRDAEDILLEFLRTNGHPRIANHYKEMTQDFWYA